LKLIKLILTLLIIASLGAVIFYAINLFYYHEYIIKDVIRLFTMCLMLINFWFIKNNLSAKSSIRFSSSILGITIFILLLEAFFQSSSIPNTWNIVFALLVLLTSVSLIDRLKISNKFVTALTALSVLLLEIILLFKIENRIFFSLTLISLMILSAISLLFVFKKK